MNLDEKLVSKAMARHPKLTRTAVVEEGLRALLARDAALRLAELGGKLPTASAPRRRRARFS